VRIAVTAAYAKSLHAIGLIHGLAAAGHEVALALEVSVWNAARLRFYLRLLGWRKLLARARARMLGGRRDDDATPEVAPMREFLREREIRSQTVSQACRAVGARRLRVRSLNDAAAIHALRAAAPDLVVYAGGGILRRAFIQTPRLGVLNAHGGPLPAFRGMNAAEWALLHGTPPRVVTIFVDEGVDTGPLLMERPIPIAAGDGVARLRGVATRVSVEALLETVAELGRGERTARPQRPEDGRQHFVMAAPLVDVLDAWLREGRTPRRNGA